MEQEQFEVGKLYRAITETVLVEVEQPPRAPGLKLLVEPDQVQVLKSIQRLLRRKFGYRPEIAAVLNALIAVVDYAEIACQLYWFIEGKQISSKDQASEGSQMESARVRTR